MQICAPLQIASTVYFPNMFIQLLGCTVTLFVEFTELARIQVKSHDLYIYHISDSKTKYSKPFLHFWT